MNRKPLLLALFALGAATLLSACGSSSKPVIAVAISGAPASLEVSDPASFSATVTNDTANAGVNWTCSPSPCGSFTPAAAPSGASTTYLAPNTAGSVTVTATSVTDSTATASATITINPIASAASLTGSYVYLVTGLDANGSYAAAGSFTADGVGALTNIEQDYCDLLNCYNDVNAAGTGSTFTIGADGRGQLVVNTLDINLGPAGSGVLTFTVALTSSSHGVIAEADTNATSNGTLDLQSGSPFALTSISGGYSFVAPGVDVFGDVDIVGAVLSADGNGNFNGGTYDENFAGDIIGPFTFNQSDSTYLAPDANGRGTMTINGIPFAYYIVGPEVVRVVENEIPGGDFLTAGSLYGQGANAFSNATLTGTFVFSESGSSVLGPFGVAGQFTGDGAGDVTAGAVDTNEGGSYSAAGSLATGASYEIPNTSGGRGVITIPAAATTSGDLATLVIYAVDPALNILDPNNTSGGGGALVLDDDANIYSSGALIPQASGASTQGNYAFDYWVYPAPYGFSNISGQFLSDGNGNVAGTADVSAPFALAGIDPGVPTAGTYVADASNAGRFTSTVTLTSTTPAFVLSEGWVIYQASGSQMVFVSGSGVGSPPVATDIGSGTLVHQ